jgi:acetylornithine deacetylase/succinyl-diaminopimelate desuccinylase-like protein
MPTETSSIQQFKEMWHEIKKEALQDYFTFLRFESISTDPKYKEQTKACAHWLTDYIQKIGFKTEIWETSSHPILFASHLEAGPDKPTLLIYNHYDVQPVDPLTEWDSPPFEPVLRGEEIYARGAQDNKGQCFYVIQALKALLRKNKKLPINIKLCIEGEEECGSESLSKALREPKRQEQLKADYLAVVDMGIPNKNTPAVTLGVRGIVTMELRLKASNTDLHSGSHGGIVVNPLHVLVEMLSKLRDSKGKVTIPGFYDDVVDMDPSQKSKISFDFDKAEYTKTFEAHPCGGESQYSPHERAWNRPTLEINGISGGYGGPGFKTVIPAKVLAKISCRLVPHQDPIKIGKLVAEHLKSLAPQSVKAEVEIYHGGGKAVRANPDSQVVQAFSKAYEELFQKPCKNIFDGGSIPIITQLAEASQSEVILLGFGLPDDQIHAPNEHFGVDRLEKGFMIMARAINLLNA